MTNNYNHRNYSLSPKGRKKDHSNTSYGKNMPSPTTSRKQRRHRQQQSQPRRKCSSGLYNMENPPGELFAIGAVLDHLCQGGELRDSTKVFQREASRSCNNYKKKQKKSQQQQQQQQNAQTQTPGQHRGLSAQHLSCITSNHNYCTMQKPETMMKTVLSSDDYDWNKNDGEKLDDDQSDRTAPTILDDDTILCEDREDDEESMTILEEDLSYILDDMTFDTYDLDTLDGDATMALEIGDTKRALKFVAMKRGNHNVEGYGDEYDDDDDETIPYDEMLHDPDPLVRLIANKVALIEQNIQQLVEDNELSAKSIKLAREQSLNGLAKQMHHMIQRQSSRRFAASDIKGDGQKAILDRKVPMNELSKFSEEEEDYEDEEEEGTLEALGSIVTKDETRNGVIDKNGLKEKPTTTDINEDTVFDSISGAKFVPFDKIDNTISPCTTPVISHALSMVTTETNIEKSPTRKMMDRPPSIPSMSRKVSLLDDSSCRPSPLRSPTSRSLPSISGTTSASIIENYSLVGSYTSSSSPTRRRRRLFRNRQSDVYHYEGVLQQEGNPGFEVQRVDNTRIEI